MGAPPAAETTLRAPPVDAANRILPALFHVPPRPFGASEIFWTAPFFGSTLFNSRPAKNAIIRLSGDQNGNEAPAVSFKVVASIESRLRTCKTWLPSRRLTT